MVNTSTTGKRLLPVCILLAATIRSGWAKSNIFPVFKLLFGSSALRKQRQSRRRFSPSPPPEEERAGAEEAALIECPSQPAAPELANSLEDLRLRPVHLLIPMTSI